MRRTLLLAGAGLLVAPRVAAAQGGDEAAVRAANMAFDAALSGRDLAGVEALSLQADHVVAIHPSSRAPLIGWAAVKRSWQEAFERFPEFAVTLEDPKVHVTGDTARVVGIEQFRARAANGTEVAFPLLTTNLYERHGGRWLMVLHHASRLPQ